MRKLLQKFPDGFDGFKDPNIVESRGASSRNNGIPQVISC